MSRMSRTPIRDAVAVVISVVLASVVVVLLPPIDSEAVEFLVWLAAFGASFWLLDRVMIRRFR
jgi:hypothetical protein